MDNTGKDTMESTATTLITKVIVVAFMLTLSVCVAGLIFSLPS